MKLDVPGRQLLTLIVAPRRGAWIETSSASLGILNGTRSHPAGVRGLKHVWAEHIISLRPSHPAGVRGLKLFVWLGGFNEPPRRTPQGCVD